MLPWDEIKILILKVILFVFPLLYSGGMNIKQKNTTRILPSCHVANLLILVSLPGKAIVLILRKAIQ